MHWAASQYNKEGVKQEPWMAIAREFYKEYLCKASAVQVGELVLHWQWKRNKNKTDINPRGRLIIAFDTQHPKYAQLMRIMAALLETLKAERRIGPAPRGPLERGASELLAEFK
eukprot:7553149-Pyramimonas_sp.AAC.1